MPAPFIIASALILAAVLIASGVTKLRQPDDADGWAELGIPAALRQPWLIRLHPIAELVLAAALLALGGVLGLLAAIAATVLFAAYLVMVWRAKTHTPDASCACFGTRKPITTRTVVRNAWLTVLAVVLTVGVSALPTFGGVAMWTITMMRFPELGGWVIAMGAAALTVYLAMQPEPAVPATPSAGGGDDDELADYLPRRIPAVPVTAGDGTVVNLRRLAALQPRLLLAVSETCGSCSSVVEKADEWQELLPEVGVHFLVATAPENSPLTRTEHPHSLHDPHQYVRDSIEEWPTPSAVLLGADGMIAGGPVSGHSAVFAFVDDIYESLHGTRPPR